VGGDHEQTRIGERLRAARTRKGLTREELAVRSGVSWSAIAQIEAGRRTHVRPSTLGACAAALGVTVDYLIGGAPQPALLEHHVLVYRSDDEFVEAAAAFLRSGVASEEPTLAVTGARNLELLREALDSDAERITMADSSDWYSQPVGALNAFRRFATEACERGAAWTRVLGEPVWSGRSADDVKSWARYESLLNLVFAGLPMTVVCAYDAQSLDDELVEHAHATHAATLGPHGVERNARFIDPGDFILRP
jgi:transcriptional regulator with XRE-family HTH domain